MEQNYEDADAGLSMSVSVNKSNRVESLKVSRAVADAALSKADRHFVTALSRGLELLACFRHGERMLGNQDLARRCGLPKSTVSRLTHTLTKLGYLVYVEESAKYSLGTAILSLGSAMLARLDIRKLAHGLMQELADFSQAMVSLGARDRLSMIYIDVVRGPAAVTLSLDLGSRIAIGTSAMGRAYLTAVPEAERLDILQRVRELDADGRWPALEAGVAQAQKDIRELGVCCSFGEWQADVNAIAVPVRPGGGLPPMAINCGAPAYIVSKDFLLEQVRPRLIKLVGSVMSFLA
jgi:DNA-binding IclR family transcriptional regulator